MGGRVLVVGSYNQDHVWSTDALPAPGATRLGRYATGPGGKGFNQAVAAARAGANTVFIAALGDDAAAAQARRLATADGIDLRDQVCPGLATGCAGIYVDADGRNMILVAPGANAALSADFVLAQQDALDSAGVLLAQLEVAPEAVLAALQAGRERGALTLLNPAPADAPTSAALLQAADLLTPNETEFAALLARHAGRELAAEQLATLDEGALHDACRALAPQASVVLTLGADGAFVSHGHHRHGDTRGYYRAPAAPADTVDTTGAGDAFSGALAAALAGGMTPFAEAVAFANRYAARSTERAGAALAMPRLDELDG
ncbi:PfkB family carbohydrate kinase [Arenimonas fontis]|uniref:Ribokinase n=1 Tax=Arenimonas fontis TaxID=2608255 RepID=A0A5B2ZBD0_9GAMM|nr:PfkB family carbohydrate kinase [Arenimonas fontis]KAA2285265.1 ribokinase [Arenimonas fontis]